jgi:hypothetical protein
MKYLPACRAGWFARCKRLLGGDRLPKLQGVQIITFQMPAPHHHKSHMN